MDGDRPRVFGLSVGNEQAIPRPVDMRPVEPQRLADPQALKAKSLGVRPYVESIAGEKPVLLVRRQEPDPLLRLRLSLTQFGRVELLGCCRVVYGGLKHRPEPLDCRRGKTDASDLLEFFPSFRSVGYRLVTDHFV